MAYDAVILLFCHFKPGERTFAVARVTMSIDDHVSRKPVLLRYAVHHLNYLSDEGLTSSSCIRTIPRISLFVPSFLMGNRFPVFERLRILSGFKFHIAAGPLSDLTVDSRHTLSSASEAQTHRHKGRSTEIVIIRVEFLCLLMLLHGVFKSPEVVEKFRVGLVSFSEVGLQLNRSLVVGLRFIRSAPEADVISRQKMSGNIVLVEPKFLLEQRPPCH